MKKDYIEAIRIAKIVMDFKYDLKTSQNKQIINLRQGNYVYGNTPITDYGDGNYSVGDRTPVKVYKEGTFMVGENILVEYLGDGKYKVGLEKQILKVKDP
jgi:hypothetical protein